VNGLLLRLAGPLQSWGERSAFTPQRDTAPFPTRSALIGMFAAAQGIGRDDTRALEQYTDLEFTVRVDRPGLPLVDYHTVGGGQPKDQTAATSGGSHKGAAVVTRRHYLADAVFVVAVTGPDTTLARIATALHQPHWAPYLGRRSCVPDEPLLLRTRTPDPVAELLTRTPLSPTTRPDETRQRSAQVSATVPVAFLWERHLGDLPTDAVSVDVNDIPSSFAQHHRAHTKRHLHRTIRQLPTALLPGRDNPLHQRLIDYAKEEQG
jgi:CRISPR system Cascade subunit CasD